MIWKLQRQPWKLWLSSSETTTLEALFSFSSTPMVALSLTLHSLLLFNFFPRSLSLISMSMRLFIQLIMLISFHCDFDLWLSRDYPCNRKNNRTVPRPSWVPYSCPGWHHQWLQFHWFALFSIWNICHACCVVLCVCLLCLSIHFWVLISYSSQVLTLIH